MPFHEKSNDRNLQRSVPMIIMTIMANHYIRIAVQNFLLTFPKVTDHEFPHSSMTWISEVRSLPFFSCFPARSRHTCTSTGIFIASRQNRLVVALNGIRLEGGSKSHINILPCVIIIPVLIHEFYT